jgi:hypothetical protein
VQVIDMPLLFETGTYKMTSSNVVVACSPEHQVGSSSSDSTAAAAESMCVLTCIAAAVGSVGHEHALA